MLGTNDLVLQGRSPEQVAERLERFLNGVSLISKILLIAPPPMTLGAWVPNQQLIENSRTLCPAHQTLAERMGLRFADAGKWGVSLAYDGGTSRSRDTEPLLLDFGGTQMKRR